MKLFAIRPILVILLMVGAMNPANAQLVDKLIGQKRETAHALMRPYKIVDYKKERVVHSYATGIHQTLLYEKDTCTRFYWAVAEAQLDEFKSLLVESGFKPNEEAGFVKDSLVLLVRKLSSGKATMFVASIDTTKLTGKREVSGKLVVDHTAPNQEPLPLLQQAILAEDKAKKSDTVEVKKKKDPQRHWIGDEKVKTSILGWELD